MDQNQLRQLLQNLTPEQSNELIAALLEETAKENPDAISPILSALAEDIELTSTMWKNGCEPMPFWDFCIALDGAPLFPRQFKVFEDTGLHKASGIFSPNRATSEIVLMWGKGSIADNTLLKCESTGLTKTAEEWCTTGECLTVKSYINGKIEQFPTSPVFCKGNIQTYTVILADGRQVSVSPDHRFLTPLGFVKMSDLVVGESSILVLPLLSDGVYDQETCISQGSQDDYLYGHHSCGVHAHGGQEFCQDDVPLQGVAHHAAPYRDVSDSDILYCDNEPYRAHRSSEYSQSAYLPLLVEDTYEGQKPEFCISPEVEEGIDRYCSLPPERKCQLQNIFLAMQLAERRGEKERLYSSFYTKLYLYLRQASQQSLSQYSSDCIDQPPSQPLYDDSCLSTPDFVFVEVASIIPHKWTKIYDLTVPVAHNYFDANGICSKNSGKDFLTGKYFAYLSYCLLNMAKEPAVVLGLAPGTHLSILNVAPSEELAKSVFFEPYLKNFLQSDVFKPYIFSERDQILSDRIIFPQINLTLFSKHSKSSGVDGFNSLAFCLDEADDFIDRASGKSLAEDIHKVLRSSCITRMKGRWLGIVISYPRHESGFMVNTYDWALKSDRCYADRGATWDINPRVSREDPDIVDDYNSDPADARMRYECLPKSAEQAFFEMPEKILEAVDGNRKPIVEVIDEEVVRVVTASDGEPIEVRYRGVVMLDVPVPVPGHEYFLSVDGGLRGDSYAIAIFHSDKIEDAVGYFCPRCGRDEELKQGATYIQVKPDNFDEIKAEIQHYDIIPQPYKFGYGAVQDDVSYNKDAICCGFCYETPMSITPGTGVLGWWKRATSDHKSIEINGRKINISHVYEDLLVEVKPFRATRSTETNKPVDYLSVQKLCEDLIRSLRIDHSRFDPWNSASIVQGLQASTGTDVQELSYSQPEQYKRARLVKNMLYSNLITLLPNDKRNREWRQLSLRGTKIDHPTPGSKDLWDCEAGAIYMAAVSSNNELEFKF